MNEQKETIRKKILFYSKQNLAVHITKHNNWFHNGVVKIVGDDHCILIDEKEGEMPIFFSEIFEVEKRDDKKE